MGVQLIVPKLFAASECMYVCVCMYLFFSLRRKGSLCLNSVRGMH